MMIMSKQKVIISFSIPVRVKEMLEELANRSYSTNTKTIVDLIRTIPWYFILK